MLATLALLGLALLGAPLFAIIAAVALLGFHQSGVDLSVVAIEFFRLAELPVLLPIVRTMRRASASDRDSVGRFIGTGMIQALQEG